VKLTGSVSAETIIL